ncbi:hypothetical protein SEEM841_03207 [Salmonella enterica subsp. enterica serovar Senftenberg str. 423984-1]|nr:hypothetical protein SEEM841_03207 [Salmonella enterica subsp. enterica serovar Senftenberg str. 423984-1]
MLQKQTADKLTKEFDINTVLMPSIFYIIFTFN